MLRILIFGILILIEACSPGHKEADTTCDNKKTTTITNNPKLSRTQKRQNFIVGQTKTANGNTIYLAFEKLNPSNREYWTAYSRCSSSLAKFLENAVLLIKRGKREKLLFDKTHNDNIAVKILKYDKDKYESVIDYIEGDGKSIEFKEKHNKNLKKLSKNISAGFAGLFFVSDQDYEEKFNIDVYMIYASLVPINEPHKNSDFQKHRSFYENFGHIEMAVSGINYRNLPVVAHYGISRNVEHFFSPDRRSKISLILHGFAAHSWMKLFPGKKYMATTPIGNMGQILKNNISEDSIFIGRDKFPDELKNLQKTGEWQDLTLGTGKKTAIYLNALAKHFLPTPNK